MVTKGPHTLSPGVPCHFSTLRLLELQGRSPKLAVAKMRLVAQWGQLQPQECAVSTHKALLRSSASIVTVVTKGPHMLSPGVRRRCQLPAATARAAGLLTKVVSDLDAACGAVGAAVASDVRGEYTQSAPPFVTSASIVTVVTEGPHMLSPGVRRRCQL